MKSRHSKTKTSKEKSLSKEKKEKKKKTSKKRKKRVEPETGIDSRSSSRYTITGDLKLETVVIGGVSYMKKQKLGTGGSGSVFEVIRMDNGTAYALKEASLRHNGSIYRGEVERLQKLKNCPHIIDLIAHDLIANDTILRMVLELGETDLEGEIKKYKGKFSDLTTKVYALEIAKGIKEMHDNSIVHLDIKLANVLIVHGVLKIVDLGLSATLRENEDFVIRDFMFGSNRPPEQIVPRKDGTYKLTKKVDVWGFGVVVYQMKYGRKPFSNFCKTTMMAVLDPNVRLQHDINAEPALTELLEMCTQREVEKRASIDDLLNHRYLKEATQLSLEPFATGTMTTTGTGPGSIDTSPNKQNNQKDRKANVTSTQDSPPEKKVA